MAKKNWKKIREAERRREERIALATMKKEQYEEKLDQDNKGILRRQKSGYADSWFSLKTIRYIKIALLVLAPISFFLYSVLLLPIVLIYALLYFPIKAHERKLNYGLRKDLHVTLPKFDSAIGLAIIVAVMSVVGVAMLTGGTTQSQFAGRNEAQIYQLLTSQGMSSNQAQTRASEIIANGDTMTRWDKALLQSSTLLTGQRVLFVGRNENATNLGGNAPVRRQEPNNNNQGGGQQGGGNQNQDGQQNLVIRNPDGSVERHQGTRDELENIANQWRRRNGMESVPLMQALTQTFKVITIILLLTVLASGTYIVLNKKEEKFA